MMSSWYGRSGKIVSRWRGCLERVFEETLPSGKFAHTTVVPSLTLVALSGSVRDLVRNSDNFFSDILR
jgi:hypothetical protein